MAKVQSKWTQLSSDFVQNTASGDGSTVAYNTSSNIFDDDAVWVTVNGLMQTKGTHYTVTLPNTITFTTAPANAQSIVVKYLKA